MATTATQGVLDTTAAEFRLPATDGKTYALDDVAGEKGVAMRYDQVERRCKSHLNVANLEAVLHSGNPALRRPSANRSL